MLKYTLLFFLSILSQVGFLFSQTKKTPVSRTKPKLIIGIVVDQMRNDYMYRYWDRYSSGGFKRLVNEGYYFKNTHYNYIPTYTGPGHASIYTGATPRAHGIISNDWFVRSNGGKIYCVQDSSVHGIGTDNKSGEMSPRNLLSSTIGDELKVNTNQESKVFSIALKDRSAILPAGHASNAAFWLDDATGNFITSSWYLNDLPVWVKTFNEQQNVKSYLEQGWTTLYPINSYSKSLKDENSFEAAPGNMAPKFPYDYASYLAKNKFSIIKTTPHGNSFTKDMAIACIKNEKLGKGNETDMLCISFSSTDYIGHSFGIRSIEIEDTYLRLDKDIESLLNFLDNSLGKDTYMIFLTADHGAAEIPAYMKELKIKAGIINESKIFMQLKKFAFANFQDSLIISDVSNQQVFLNEQIVKNKKLSLEQVEAELINYLLSLPGISEVYPANVLKYNSFANQYMCTLLQNGYNHKMSGNLCFLFEPAWIDHEEKGTTHGSGYVYDTHVPLIFFGLGIKFGQSSDYTTITQIAPTICEYLKISCPNSTFAEPLNILLK